MRILQHVEKEEREGETVYERKTRENAFGRGKKTQLFAKN